MPWVVFADDFDFTPRRQRQVTIAFKAGHRLLVTQECAAAAVAAGKARRIKTPPRTANPVREGG